MEHSPREGRIPVAGADLYFREIGHGPPVILLHGGPDFDHSYFLPEMDRLCDTFRLVYYDQRGRGRSADRVRPEDVTLASEGEDLERVRSQLRLGRVTLLGHSWGAVLALEYALRHPDRVSHLILMNPSPASHEDYTALREERLARLGADFERLKAAAATPGYAEGDPDAVAAYYRIHFKLGLVRPEHLDQVISRLEASFTPEGVLKARAVEDRLMEETWRASGYDLLPRLASLRIPTLVLHGDHDLIPVPIAEGIARAIPGARFVLIEDCGHFSYLERPEEAFGEIRGFLRG